MASHLVTYESDSSKTQVDYCLVRRNQRTFLKDIKVLPSIRHWYETPGESLHPEERYGNYMKIVKKVISGHTSTKTEQAVKKCIC